MIVLLVVTTVSPFFGQTRVNVRQRKSPAGANRAIANIVREIDARNIETTIRKLVSSAREIPCPNRTIRNEGSAPRVIGCMQNF